MGPPQSPNHSIVKTTTNECLTDVDLADAKTRADKIVKDNRRVERGDACTAAE